MKYSGDQDDVVETAQEGGDIGTTVAVPIFEEERKRLLLEGAKLHQDCTEIINESEKEVNWFPLRHRNNKEDANILGDWRKPRQKMFNSNEDNFFKWHKFNKYTTGDTFFCHSHAIRTNIGTNKLKKKKSKSHNRLKFCPGQQCTNWLSISQFAKNNNTFSGFDKYCVLCNRNRRQQIQQRRNRLRYHGCITDSLERFKENEEKNKNTEGASCKKQLLRQFYECMQICNKVKNTPTTAFTAEKVYTILFGGKFYICDHSGLPLTPPCFLRHNHKISLDERGNKCYLFCQGIKQ
jgi:hypothetical protein